MRAEHNSHRQSCRNPIYLPAFRSKTSQINHAHNTNRDKNIHPLERLEDLRDFLEEIGRLGLLRSRAPFHVDAKHMGKESKEKVEGNSTKEYGEHWHPFKVLDERGNQCLLSEAVAKNGETDIAEAAENDYESNKDLPRLHVEFVEVTVVPSDKEIVQEGQWKTEC